MFELVKVMKEILEQLKCIERAINRTAVKEIGTKGGTQK